MKISIEWLQEYLDLPVNLAQLREDLTMIGLLVESISEDCGTAVLELEITSNRPDCLSYLGVAREIAALYNQRLKYPRTARVLRISEERIPYSIEIRDPDLCPRYVGLVLDGIRVAPSPEWMQRRLEASGVRPVNNIVDITNYILLERGHPLHAFDFDRLHEGRIVVARACAGQKMMTLDGVERELDDQMLLINDGAGPVAIGGVMGGRDSEIGEWTQRVLLECAYFQPASIRRTSKKLGLSTEASYRFERGADWNGLTAAIARTCYLIQKLAGGRIAGSIRDILPAAMAPIQIELVQEHAESLLGVSLTPARIQSMLRRLNFKPVRKGAGRWLVQCPTYRADMELEADLIEEVARFYGYQNIPTTIPASKTVGKPSHDSPYESSARRILLGLGYTECINLSFASEQQHHRFPLTEGQALEIRNPLTEETQFLRAHLAPGLVRTAKHNFNHNQRMVNVFEIGKVFRRSDNGAVVERNTLGLLGTGGWAGGNWDNPATDYDFFHLKGIITTFLAGMRCAPVDIVPDSQVSWLDSATVAALVIDGRRFGVMGRLHPDIEEEFKLKQPVFLAEIDFQGLYPYLLSPVRHEPLPRFPAVERDISIVVSQDVSYGALRDGVLGLKIAELAALDLVDVYGGDQIRSGRVSMTLRLTFLDHQGTLTVDRVQSFSDNIRSFLHDHFGTENR
ncbi:MAG: phenylalanine--tRNA ligase subunit beta [Acidobacteriota bacterium]|jgi:phenylalanyl-tRNA synthetase beta chain